jgi:hypothetical protein
MQFPQLDFTEFVEHRDPIFGGHRYSGGDGLSAANPLAGRFWENSGD